MFLINTEDHTALKACSFNQDSTCWCVVWHSTLIGHEDHHKVQQTMTTYHSRHTTLECLEKNHPNHMGNQCPSHCMRHAIWCGRSVVCFGAVEWRFLLSGVALGAVANLPNPAPRWLTDKSWTQILNLSSLPAFQVDLPLMLCLSCTNLALSHDHYSLQINWTVIMRK